MKKIFSVLTFLFFALFSLAGCSSGYGLKELASYDGATLYITKIPSGDGNIKVIKLSGSFTKMGTQYGYLMKEYLSAMYQDVVLNYLIEEKGLNYNTLLSNAETSYASALEQTKEFIQGAVTGSGLSLSQLQLINYAMIADIYGGCSALAAWGTNTNNGPLVLGRNWDMLPLDKFKDYMMVVVYNPETGNSVADINYMGQFQFFQSAMNNKGLWIDLQDGHMASTATDDNLQDANSAILEFLMNSSTMEELDAYFMSKGSSSSFIMTVADPNVSYSYFWCTQGTYKFTEPDQVDLLSTSNHFVEYPDTWTINTLPTDPACRTSLYGIKA